MTAEAARARDRSPRPVVELRHVSKIYGDGRGQVRALADVTFTIGQNEVVALVGPSGCGKSTTLRVIAGLMPASSGQVELALPPTGQVGNGGVAMMFQTPALLDWRTVEGNVSLALEAKGVPSHAARVRSREMLASVGLELVYQRRPFELSGGMQQRVAIARTLVSDPALILLDEPFGSLDAITRDHICLEFARICEHRDISALLVTHSITEAIFLADRILVMASSPGRIIEEVEVLLPRPRTLADRLSDAARDLEAHLLTALMEDASQKG